MIMEKEQVSSDSIGRVCKCTEQQGVSDTQKVVQKTEKKEIKKSVQLNL